MAVLGSYKSKHTGQEIDNAIEKAKISVPNTRQINGKPLTNDINLKSSDVGAVANNQGSENFNKVLMTDSLGNVYLVSKIPSSVLPDTGVSVDIAKSLELLDGTVISSDDFLEKFDNIEDISIMTVDYNNSNTGTKKTLKELKNGSYLPLPSSLELINLDVINLIKGTVQYANIATTSKKVTTATINTGGKSQPMNRAGLYIIVITIEGVDRNYTVPLSIEDLDNDYIVDFVIDVPDYDDKYYWVKFSASEQAILVGSGTPLTIKSVRRITEY